MRAVWQAINLAAVAIHTFQSQEPNYVKFATNKRTGLQTVFHYPRQNSLPP